MKCPHCDQEISGPSCPQCGTMSPEGANYCMECGASFGETTEVLIEDDDNDDNDNDIDFENRVLCPDGTCTGIIIDGKCTECGNQFEET